MQGVLYVGSDGSEKDGIGAHTYGFTSSWQVGKVWGGAALTPWGAEEMASLRTELGGLIGALLVLYAMQVQRGNSTHPIKIWIDNSEVLARTGNMLKRRGVKQHLVLDYDLW